MKPNQTDLMRTSAASNGGKEWWLGESAVGCYGFSTFFFFARDSPGRRLCGGLATKVVLLSCSFFPVPAIWKGLFSVFNRANVWDRTRLKWAAMRGPLTGPRQGLQYDRKKTSLPRLHHSFSDTLRPSSRGDVIPISSGCSSNGVLQP